MKLEFILALFQNLSGWSKVFSVLSGVGLIVGLIGVAVCQAEIASLVSRDRDIDEWNGLHRGWRSFKNLAMILFFVTLPLSMVPTVDQMFKIRLDLIKFQLASPENVQSGVEAIKDVAHKLECKYLGCPEPKEEKKKE